ncbi:MAG TPA: TetR/AcrR family transcriptional regulator C-terminal domain-containing protein [Polyangium sp.]|nr:TetR/AcrR family transcriptional regulator C-terminal domain-containing protein [Polyangium sp.]
MRLRREQVVSTALRLLDEVGLDALTMRRLGPELNVQAATLYWHVKNKQELLDAMAEAMLADCVVRAPEGPPWMDRAANMAERLRRALLAYRDGARVFAGTYVTQENTLRFADTWVGALREAGLSPRAAAWGTWTMVYYTIGFTLEEQALAPLPGTEGGKVEPEHLRAALARGAYSHLGEASTHLLDADLDARFRYGIQLILAGLEAAPGDEPSDPAPEGPRRRSPRRSR